MADKARVGILMGSDNDWTKINGVGKALTEFGVPFEVNVMSAHRCAEDVKAYVQAAPGRGIEIFICAAGGAAHLAGVVASLTTHPVIAIPVETALAGGLDSLLSMVQMPGDIPVACVGTTGIGGARNAGILAVQMLALADADLRKKLLEFRAELPKKIAAKNAALQERIKNGE